MLVEFLFATGLRIQEALAAAWEWIDREVRTIRVVRQVRRSGEFALPKGKKIRTAVVLPSWWSVHRDSATGLIFATAQGMPVASRKASELITEVLERAGKKLPGECAHAFRHTYSYLMLKNGASMEELQKCLGHGDIRTTQRYYDHWSADHAARSGVNKIYGREKV
jgi:integrase